MLGMRHSLWRSLLQIKALKHWHITVVNKTTLLLLLESASPSINIIASFPTSLLVFFSLCDRERLCLYINKRGSGDGPKNHGSLPWFLIVPCPYPKFPHSGKVINQANYLCGKWRKFFPGLCTLQLTHHEIRLARRPHLLLSLTLVYLRLPSSYRQVLCLPHRKKARQGEGR